MQEAHENTKDASVQPKRLSMEMQNAVKKLRKFLRTGLNNPGEGRDLLPEKWIVDVVEHVLEEIDWCDPEVVCLNGDGGVDLQFTSPCLWFTLDDETVVYNLNCGQTQIQDWNHAADVAACTDHAVRVLRSLSSKT